MICLMVFALFSSLILTRRVFNIRSATIMASSVNDPGSNPKMMESNEDASSNRIRLAVTGDFMIGRGIDAIMPNHVDGVLYESYMKHARHYVEIAEKVNGPLPKKEIQDQGCAYIWGDLLAELNANPPDCFIVNLETALTTNEKPYPKSINYRCHPANVECLTVAGVHVATLANNHVLDWGSEGLVESIVTLEKAGVLFAGAGRNNDEARTPTEYTCKTSNACVRIAAVGFPTAGVPLDWSAGGTHTSGVHVYEHASAAVAQKIAKSFGTQNKEEDAGGKECIKVASLHWGPNWGWGTPAEHRKFAHALIDAGVHVVIGHSSHHVKGLEVYKGCLIAYGLGDFLNDYEGIVGQGYELFRDDLSCLYMPFINSKTGKLIRLDIIPLKIHNLRVNRLTNPDDIEWLRYTFSREGAVLGTECETYRDVLGNINLRISWKE
mmetsp:Transcript_21052/g.32122  ORF Transcript_21052/g.32122 Transcript_21052/m.32122 type:complete len:437 (+) Transcript_21052:1525-2835(+)